MAANKNLTAAYDMLYLVGCAVNQITPELEKTAEMNFEAVYALCRYHNLLASAFMAIEASYGQNLPQNELMNKWREAKDRAVRKIILLDVARAELFDFLESRGIWHLPLKGIILKEIYPKPGMREMSDNDILFDKNHSSEVYDWFCGNGYKPESVGVQHDDSYHKPPVFNFEMHTSLFAKHHNPLWVEYYANVEERLLNDGEGSYARRFSDEDFYIHTVLHSYKHYAAGGIGVRSLLDCYVYVKAKDKTLDWNYINKELKKLGAAGFEKQTRELSLKLFSQPQSLSAQQFSQKEKKLIEYYVSSGAFGTAENKVKNALSKEKSGKPQTKFKFILSRVFPDKDFMLRWYGGRSNIFCRYKYLLPFAWLHRMFSGGVQGLKSKWREFKTVRRM